MILTDSERSLILKCISSEKNRTTHDNYYENLSRLEKKVINKPSTTTNEQPTTEQIDNALDCLHGDNSCNHSKVISYLNQFT